MPRGLLPPRLGRTTALRSSSRPQRQCPWPQPRSAQAPRQLRGSAGPSGGGVPRTFRHMVVISRCVTTTETAAAPALMPFQISRFFASSTGCIVSEGVMLSNGTGAKATRRSCHEAPILSWRVANTVPAKLSGTNTQGAWITAWHPSSRSHGTMAHRTRGGGTG